MFHLDEYLGLPANHSASFKNYLKKRFVDKIKPGKVFFIQGHTSNPTYECKRISDLISKRRIDVVFLGIGENGHLAFNDPPADFETEEPYIVVNLDAKCRKQQFSEGWFKSIEDVPKKAITMSIIEIMRPKILFVLVLIKERLKLFGIVCLTKLKLVLRIQHQY